MQKTQILRDQAIEELEIQLNEKREELFRLRNEKRIAKKFDRPHLFRQTKREVARLLTIIREKESIKK